MRDKITKLCDRLLGTKEPETLQPIADELQQAMHDRIETVRQDFVDVALIDRMMELEGFYDVPTDEMRN
jgi:hypothetical protein